MGYLTKQMINDAEDRQKIEIDVPEWGGTAILMALSGSDLDKFEQLYTDPEKMQKVSVRAFLVSRCLVDENDRPLFSESEVHQLSRRNGAVLTRVFRECVALNKIDDDEDIEAAVADFDGDPDESSTTD